MRPYRALEIIGDQLPGPSGRAITFQAFGPEIWTTFTIPLLGRGRRGRGAEHLTPWRSRHAGASADPSSLARSPHLDSASFDGFKVLPWHGGQCRPLGFLGRQPAQNCVYCNRHLIPADSVIKVTFRRVSYGSVSKVENLQKAFLTVSRQRKEQGFARVVAAIEQFGHSVRSLTERLSL